MNVKRLFKTAFVLFMFVATSIGLMNAQTVNYNFKDGSLIFKLKDNYTFNGKINEDKSVQLTDLTFMSSMLSKYGVTRVSRELDALKDPKLLRIFFVQFSEINRVDEFLNELKQVSVVEYVEKDARRKTFWTPNDPYYSSSFSGINLRWHLDLIKASQAWDIQQGVASVKVGIVDNAIWAEHPDLGISASNQCNASVSPATTGTGKSSPPTSVSQTTTCTDPNACPSYEWSHGTHCSGLIGAKNNNSLGVSSIGGGVTIIAARAADDAGDMWTTNITRGANFCVGLSIKVLSMSLGGTTSSPTEQTQFTTYYNNGITIVAAAGNEGDQGNAVNYPAGYNNVISVAAVDSDKKLASFSQYGSWVDIACSGGNHTSGMNLISTTYCTNQFLRLSGLTSITGNYDGMQGTSMATPMVAGLCGLLLSKNPSATPAQIESCLKTTSQPLASGSNTIMSGSGVVDAQAALNCIGGSTTPYANFSANVTSGSAPLTVTFTDASTPGTGTITNRAWTFTGGSPATAGNVTSQSVTYSTAGTYTVSLTITNSSNATDVETKTGYITVTAAGSGFSLNFEACSDFQTTFSPWTGVDVDGSATYGITDVTFPGSGTAMSFIAFNPSTTTPATTGADAHGGARFGASFCANPAPNNDWLISPSIHVGGSNWKLSMWVRSYTDSYGLETYKVGVNTAGNQPANFSSFLTGASAIQAPLAWTLKEFSLASYNNQNIYVGINCTSNDAFIFMLDDILIGAPTSIEDQDLNSGVILSPNPASDVFFLNFSDNSFDNADIVITDLNGRMVKTLKYNQTNTGGIAIDTSDMANGLYLVSIKNNNKSITKKVSITR